MNKLIAVFLIIYLILTSCEPNSNEPSPNGRFEEWEYIGCDCYQSYEGFDITSELNSHFPSKWILYKNGWYQAESSNGGLLSEGTFSKNSIGNGQTSVIFVGKSTAKENQQSVGYYLGLKNDTLRYALPGFYSDSQVSILLYKEVKRGLFRTV